MATGSPCSLNCRTFQGPWGTSEVCLAWCKVSSWGPPRVATQVMNGKPSHIPSYSLDAVLCGWPRQARHFSSSCVVCVGYLQSTPQPTHQVNRKSPP